VNGTRQVGYGLCGLYEVESNENLKYVLSRSLLNTKGTQ